MNNATFGYLYDFELQSNNQSFNFLLKKEREFLPENFFFNLINTKAKLTFLLLFNYHSIAKIHSEVLTHQLKNTHDDTLLNPLTLLIHELTKLKNLCRFDHQWATIFNEIQELELESQSNEYFKIAIKVELLAKELFKPIAIHNKRSVFKSSKGVFINADVLSVEDKSKITLTVD
jgi:hypothetical protein